MSRADAPFISVVVPVRNAETTIGDCLASIVRAGYPVDRREVVVVDNASTDRTAEIIRRYPVRYIYEGRLGRSAARNRGIQESRGEIIAFIDSDCVASTLWLRELAAGFTDDEVFGVAGEILAFPPTTIAERYYAMTRARPQASSLNESRPYTVTANVAFRKGTFDRIGLFDRRFRSGQDVDFSWRFFSAGLRLVYRDRAVVFHRHRPTGWGLFMQYFFRAQGRALLHQKHGPPWSVGEELRHYRKLLEAVGIFGRSALRYRRFGKEPMELYFAYYEVVKRVAILLGSLYGHVRALPERPYARPRAPRTIERSMRTAGPPLGTDERRLLLACARVSPTEQEISELGALLRGPLDWSAVLFFARLHSVTPLLHRRLRNWEDVPRDVRRELLKLYQRAGYQNRLFAREHSRLVDAFNAAGVRILVPKGLSVVELAYGSLSNRPLIDLMYLTSASDMGRAADVLRAEGYEPQRVRPREALYRWSCPQFMFKKKTEGLVIRVLLQPTLVTSPRLHRFDMDRVWAEARPAQVGNREVLVLSPVDQLLYLCLQADSHGFLNRAAIGRVDPTELLFAGWSNNRLVRFVDIRESVRIDERVIDWTLVVERAGEAMLGESVHASLLLTNQLLGPTAPPEVIYALQPRIRPRLRSWLLEGLSGSPSAKSAQRVIASRWEAVAPRQQVILAHLVGLGELTAPAPEALKAADNSQGDGSLIVRYAKHTGGALLRSGSGLLRAWLDDDRSRRAAGQKR
jgi:glycosyltransferase involved in cell wall biosynthesis